MELGLNVSRKIHPSVLGSYLRFSESHFHGSCMTQWWGFASFQQCFVPRVRIESVHLCDCPLAAGRSCSASQKSVPKTPLGGGGGGEEMSTIFYSFSCQEVEFLCPPFGSWPGHVTCLSQWNISKRDRSRRLKSASAFCFVCLCAGPASAENPSATTRTSRWRQAQPSRHDPDLRVRPF